MKMTVAALGRMGVIALAIGAGGCASIKTSSNDHLRPDESSATVPCTLGDASDSVSKIFKERGVPIVSETEPSATTRMLKFKGPRVAITTVSGGSGSVTSSTDAIGSVYYVWLAADGKGGTKATVLGKPTANGLEPCAPSDWSNIKCDGIWTGAGWSGRDQMTGREESEMVTGLLVEYRKSCSAPAPAAAAPAIAAPAVAPASAAPAAASATPAPATVPPAAPAK